MNSENSNPDSDFIKLINEMKDELDNMGDVYSLLVQGNLLNRFYFSHSHLTSITILVGVKCRMFALDFKFNILYRLVLLDHFYFPTDKYDIRRLDSCFDSMLYLEVSNNACLMTIKELTYNFRVWLTIWRTHSPPFTTTPAPLHPYK